MGTGTPTQYTDHPFGFTWTGGTPTATATATQTGIYVEGQNNGLRISAPADTTQRTLVVFVDAWNAQGRMVVAHLSDNSVADYVDTSLNGTTTATAVGMYTFVYRAASAGQTLTVTFTQNDTRAGNVALQAAALGLSAPDFTIGASACLAIHCPGREHDLHGDRLARQRLYRQHDAVTLRSPRRRHGDAEAALAEGAPGAARDALDRADDALTALRERWPQMSVAERASDRPGGRRRARAPATLAGGAAAARAHRHRGRRRARSRAGARPRAGVRADPT